MIECIKSIESHNSFYLMSTDNPESYFVHKFWPINKELNIWHHIYGTEYNGNYFANRKESSIDKYDMVRLVLLRVFKDDFSCFIEKCPVNILQLVKIANLIKKYELIKR